MISTICDVCKKEFSKKPQSSKKQCKHNFCSRECYGKWRKEQQTGKNNPHWEGGKIKVTCEHCKKEFEVFPNYAKTRKHLFCTPECYRLWKQKEAKK